MSRVELEPKNAAEIATETFDFTSRCAASETLSTATVATAVYSGATGATALTLHGAATISGQKVTQRVGGGDSGVVYLLTCTVTTSTGQTLALSAYLPIVPRGT